MRKVIWTMLLAVVSTSAMAEWTRVDSNEDGTSYVDLATIRKEGDRTKVWVLFDKKTAQTIDSGTFLSTKRQHEFDCKEGLSRYLNFAFHSENMGGGKAIYAGSEPGKWSPVTPGSIKESQWKTVCGQMSKIIPSLSAVQQQISSGTKNGLPAEDRLMSCDPSVAIAAAEEIISKQTTLKDPLLLFMAAATLFQHGKKDEAVFWFYAAQLRTRYQLVFENGDRGQLLAIMLMTIGTPINNYAFQDANNLRHILDKVLEWDKTTPNLFRDKPHSDAEEQKIALIYTGIRDFQSKIIAERTDLEAKARKAAPEIERMYTAKSNPKCRADQVDPASATQETEKEKKLVSAYILSNPEVIQDAGEIKNTWVEIFSTKSTDTMPSRYEVGVVSSAGKESHAIVDVSRSGSEVKFKLYCIARKRWVLRDPTKDPCNQ